jgi:hypothetical protein
MENSMEAPQKTNNKFPYDPEIPFLGLYPKDCMSGYSKVTCTPMITAALVTIAKLQKQPIYHTTDEWIKELWYLYTMEFHLDIKKKEILSFAGK